MNKDITEESGIQKHISFWDKRNKGYITPADTISGFIALGYSVIFSIALGTFAGIFLSVLSQTTWLPDPFCRTFPKLLNKHTSGVYDKDGVFIPERFEKLFDKHSKSSESITITEFFEMTKEQEELGTNLKAWALTMIELSSAYFFIGHRGSLSREDVRAAYDGSLFYRLKDNTVNRKKTDASTYSPLAGSYLLSSRKRGMRIIESRINSLLNSLPINNSNLSVWINYLKENAESVKDYTIPRFFRSSSVIRGVPSPKPDFFFGMKHDPVINNQDDDEQAPIYLTGVSQSTPYDDVYSGSLLGKMGVKCDMDEMDKTLFENLTKKDDSHIRIVNHQDSELMNSFLREDEESTATWHAEKLTGVKDDESKMINIVQEKMQDSTDDENLTDNHYDHVYIEQSSVEPIAMTPPPDDALIHKSEFATIVLEEMVDERPKDDAPVDETPNDDAPNKSVDETPKDTEKTNKSSDTTTKTKNKKKKNAQSE